MKKNFIFPLIISAFLINCSEKKEDKKAKETISKKILIEIPEKNKKIIEIVKKYGPSLSSTYEKAVCTELVIQVINKTTTLNNTPLRVLG
jgi:hypothetical protein